MVKAARPLVEKTSDLQGIPRAFRPNPLTAEEMQFYSDSLNRRRGNQLQRRMRDDLLNSAEQGFFFKGVLYGNRGTGKSTEINRMLEDPDVCRRFLVIRLDALDQLNPQTFSVADVLLLLGVSLIEGCQTACDQDGRAFHEAPTMINDLQQQLAPFFPELQNKEQKTTTTGGGGELNILQVVKLMIRVEGQRRVDITSQRESLANLRALLDRLISIAQARMPEYELLIIGENFDKEQIPQALLVDTFVQYSAVLRDLRLHLLFTLPVPFVYSYGEQLPFNRANRYPIYDIPVFTENHQPEMEGRAALIELLEKRASLDDVFAKDALDLLLRASGGDLFLLFALINRAGQLALYRHEDDRNRPD